MVGEGCCPRSIEGSGGIEGYGWHKDGRHSIPEHALDSELFYLVKEIFVILSNAAVWVEEFRWMVPCAFTLD